MRTEKTLLARDCHDRGEQWTIAVLLLYGKSICMQFVALHFASNHSLYSNTFQHPCLTVEGIPSLGLRCCWWWWCSSYCVVSVYTRFSPSLPLVSFLLDRYFLVALSLNTGLVGIRTSTARLEDIAHLDDDTAQVVVDVFVAVLVKIATHGVLQTLGKVLDELTVVCFATKHLGQTTERTAYRVIPTESTAAERHGAEEQAPVDGLELAASTVLFQDTTACGPGKLLQEDITLVHEDLLVC